MNEDPKQPDPSQEQPQSAPPADKIPEKVSVAPLSESTIKKLPQQLSALSTCFAKPFDAFRKSFKDPAEADRVMAREIDFAAQAMLKNNYLVTVASRNPESLVNALKNVALTGSTLNPVLKQAYLVPFGSEITFMPSYMGLVDLLANNGLVRKVEAHCVFDGDEFEIRLGTNGGLYHKPNAWGKREKENLKGVYYFVVLTDGTEMYDTMSVEEIEKIRLRAPSAKSKSPWDTDYLEMAKKTLVRRAFKMIPKNGISEDKIKSLEAVFDYDEKSEQDWISRIKNEPKVSHTFDEEAEYEELN